MCDCVTKVVGGPPPTITVCFALPCGSPTCCSYAVFVLSLGLLLRVLCKNAGRAVHVADQNALMILCSEIRLPRSLTHFPSLALDVWSVQLEWARGAHDFRACPSRITCVFGI